LADLVKPVTIVIPSLHRPDLVANCLRFIAAQQVPGDFYDVVVVENQARSDSVLTGPLPANVRQILLEENYGTTGSINRALAVTSSNYVLILNNDVELEPRYLAVLTAALEADPQAAFAIGKLRCATDKARLDGAGDAILQGGGSYRLGHYDLDTGQFDQPARVLCACGAAVLFRRTVLDQAGGLDEKFFAYLDDVDLALRAHLLGYRGLYVPDAVAYHIGSATLGNKLHPKIVRLLTRNQLLVYAKDYPAGVLLRVLPQALVFQLLWFALAIRSRGLVPYLGGIFEAITLLPGMLQKRHAMMRQRRIGNDEFLDLLRHSERAIFDWHSRQSDESRSLLLRIYFGLFRPAGRP